MKKKFIGGFLALSFAAMIGINANIGLNNQAEEPSIAISNVEALANGEEFTITCGRFSGRCWTYSPSMSGEYWSNCRPTGNPNDYCI